MPKRVPRSAVAISGMRISPNRAIGYHNKQASLNLRKGNYAGFRYHTKEAYKINLGLFRLRARKRS